MTEHLTNTPEYIYTYIYIIRKIPGTFDISVYINTQNLNSKLSIKRLVNKTKNINMLAIRLNIFVIPPNLVLSIFFVMILSVTDALQTRVTDGKNRYRRVTEVYFHKLLPENVTDKRYRRFCNASVTLVCNAFLTLQTRYRRVTDALQTRDRRVTDGKKALQAVTRR